MKHLTIEYKMRYYILVIIGFFAFLQSAHAKLTNYGFETSNFTGWSASSGTSISTGIDTDGDGIPDDNDDDADNDGIPNSAECTQSNFFWSNPPTISGNTATGTINGIGYTYTSSSPVTTTTYMYSNATFPSSYNVPNSNPTIQNIYVTSNTLTFSSPMTNPVLVFASIGNGNQAVPISFSAPIQVVWSTNVVQNSSTQITGTEGYAIIRLMGTFTSVGFNYQAAENWCNFAFGADFQSCGDTDGDGIPDYLDTDSDNDGCPDAIEGSMNFSLSQTQNGRLVGAVNSQGIPVIAGAGQGIGTSKSYNANCSCQPGIDKTPPVALAQNIIVQLDGSGNASTTAALVNNGSSDACGIKSMVLSKTAFDCSNIGSNTVTLTVTDNNNNVSTANAIVTVQDKISPVINCVPNQTIASCAEVIPDYTKSATVSDNCSAGGVTMTQSPAAGTSIASGATVSVTLTAMDASNNSATCPFTVTRPNITPVANNDAVTVCAGSSVTFNVLGNDSHPQGAALTVSDNTNPSVGTLIKNPDNTFTYTSLTPSSSPVTFTYTIKANDGVIPFSGNNHYYEWVPVNGITWQQAKAQAASKTFNGMQGYLVTVTSAAEMAFVTSKLKGQGWMGASDLANEGVWRWVTGPEGLEEAGLGRHFSNQSKTGNCSAYTAPGINDNYANWSGGEPNDCGANIGQFAPTDPNRGGEHYAHFINNGFWNDFPNSVGGNITGYVVEYGGLESCTPVLTATATVTITVNPKPVLSAVTTNVMCVGGNNGAIDLSVSSGQTPFTYTWSNGASTQNVNNLPTGTYTVTVTTANGCSSQGSYTINQVDNVPPVALAKNVTVQLDASGNGSTTAALVNNGSSDACGIKSMVLSKLAFNCADISTNPNVVTLTVTDNNNNVSTATAEIMVVDATAPTAIAQNVTVQLDATGNGSTTAALVNNGSSDACSIKSLALSKTAFTCSDIATNPNVVTLTVTDNHGNVSTATANVTVVDAIAPVAIAKNVTVQLDATGNGNTTAALVDNGSNDACGIKTLALSKTAFTCSDIATNPNVVTLTVTDNNGNVSTATATVTVQDNIAPTLTVPVNIVKLNDPGVCGAVVNIGQATATDNCSVATITNNAPAFFPVGITTVTWTAVDVNGNSTTGTQLVEITNNAPVISGLTVSPLLQLGVTTLASATHADNNLVAATWNWGDGLSTPGTISGTQLSGNHVYSQTGLFNITLTIEDACGKSDTKTYSYVVIYNPCNGFVTGGGNFITPTGSYTANTSLTGKSNYGFEVKYEEGKKVPEGEFEFQFTAAKFKVKATTFDWLMVNSDMAVMKGNAKVNEKDGYHFIASVVDGKTPSVNGTDNLRLIVWDNAGNVLYDNQKGDPDYARALIPITKGQIVIHKYKHEKCFGDDFDNKDEIAHDINMDDENGGQNEHDNSSNDENKNDNGSKTPILVEMTVYPNPMVNIRELDITIKNFGNTVAKVELAYINGRVVYSTPKVEFSSGKAKIDFSKAKLTPGNYLITVSENGTMRVGVKQIIVL